MKCVIQRVSSSKVTVDNRVIGSIGVGLNILFGAQKGDSKDDVKKLVNKIIKPIF